MAVIKNKIISTGQSILLKGNNYKIFKRDTLSCQIYIGTNSSITFAGDITWKN